MAGLVPAAGDAAVKEADLLSLGADVLVAAEWGGNAQTIAGWRALLWKGLSGDFGADIQGGERGALQMSGEDVPGRGHQRGIM